jgi:DNA-binding response OmpR family regulator
VGERDKTRVLIIDDEPFIAKAAAGLLRKGGFEVSTCLEWLQISHAVHDAKPDVILLDVNMPVLKGNDICEVLRGRMKKSLKQAKIVLYSSEPEPYLARLVGECGADGYILKNTPGAELLRKVRELVA